MVHKTDDEDGSNELKQDSKRGPETTECSEYVTKSHIMVNINPLGKVHAKDKFDLGLRISFVHQNLILLVDLSHFVHIEMFYFSVTVFEHC